MNVWIKAIAMTCAVAGAIFFAFTRVVAYYATPEISRAVDGSVHILWYDLSGYAKPVIAFSVFLGWCLALWVFKRGFNEWLMRRPCQCRLCRHRFATSFTSDPQCPKCYGPAVSLTGPEYL